MKKALVLIIAFLMVISITTVSFAERFSVRNGIQFGMTTEEVREKEIEISGIEPTIYKSDETGKIFGIVNIDINIDGYNLARLIYSFDDNEKLYEIQYIWKMDYYAPDYVYQPDDKTHVFSIEEEAKIYDEYQKMYDMLNGALAEKYKQIGSYSNGKFNYINYNAPEHEGIGIYPYLFDTGKGQYTDVYGITQYITNDDNNYVEVVSYCYEQIFNSSRNIEVQIGYRTIPEELYNSIPGITTVYTVRH